MTHPIIRVLIVDDQTLVRKGTMALLAQVNDIVVVGEAADGKEAITQTATLLPDVIVIDVEIPKLDAVNAIQQIYTNHPAIRVLALAKFGRDETVVPIIKAGILGYLLKDAEPEELVTAIRQVFLGKPSFPPHIVHKMMCEIRQPLSQTRITDHPLTTRELEILCLVARGFDDVVIAKQLILTEITVRTHISHILKKLHLTNRVQATLYALRTGAILLEDNPKED